MELTSFSFDQIETQKPYVYCRFYRTDDANKKIDYLTAERDKWKTSCNEIADELEKEQIIGIIPLPGADGMGPRTTSQ